MDRMPPERSVFHPIRPRRNLCRDCASLNSKRRWSNGIARRKIRNRRVTLISSPGNSDSARSPHQALFGLLGRAALAEAAALHPA